MDCDLNWLFEEEKGKTKNIINKLKNNKALLLIFLYFFAEDSYLSNIIILLAL